MIPHNVDNSIKEKFINFCIETAVQVFGKYYSEEVLRDLVNFYKSESERQLIMHQGKVTEETIRIAQEQWPKNLSEVS